MLHRAYAGLTLLFSRFAHCFPGEQGARLIEGLQRTLDEVRPEGAVFAELRGGYDATNLNLHPAVTPYQLVCPGETSSRPAAEQLPLEDLEIVDDVVADRLLLRSRRLRSEVIPVYLGFLLPMALPEVQQILLNFSYTGMANLDLWTGTSAPRAGEGIARYPRIRYRNVISVLKNPFYAGVYAYGKSEKRTTLVEGRLRKTYKHGKPVDQWIIPDAPQGIKFALGENPKRSNSQGLPATTPRPARTSSIFRRSTRWSGGAAPGRSRVRRNRSTNRS